MTRRAFPQHSRFAAASIVPSDRPQQQLDDDVRRYYDRWKSEYLLADGVDVAGNALWRISFGSVDRRRTVSEGQGFGMIIVATMAGYDLQARELFDGLWRFALKHPSAIDGRLMSFEVPSDEEHCDSAFDGDCDIAWALLLADAQWGSDGEVDYLNAARLLITGLKESTIGPQSRLPMLGDWVEAGGAVYDQYTTRSSDFILDHFRSFAAATSDGVWGEVIAATQEVIERMQAEHSPSTGLLPDFIIASASSSDQSPRPAGPFFLEDAHDGAFWFNAGRDPWRLAIDALHYGDARSTAAVRRMSRWMEKAAGGDPRRIVAGYALDGTPLGGSDSFTSFFAAPFGVAAMLLPESQQWLNDVYSAVCDRHEDYYEDSVTLLSLLTMTRNSWSPELP